MAKSRTRGRAGKTAQARSPQHIQKSTRTTTQSSAVPLRRIKTVQKAQNMQGLVLPSMVALGCWGLAFSFVFMTSSQNHVIYGALAALMALMWSLNLGLRVRKVLQQK